MKATYEIIWQGIRNGKTERQSIKTFNDYNKAEAWLDNYVKENGYALSDFMMKRSEA